LNQAGKLLIPRYSLIGSKKDGEEREISETGKEKGSKRLKMAKEG